MQWSLSILVCQLKVIECRYTSKYKKPHKILWCIVLLTQSSSSPLLQLIHEELLIWIWEWYLHYLQNDKPLTLEHTSIFQSNWKSLTSKSWYFKATEDSIIKFKSQALHIKIIKWRKANGSNGSGKSLLAQNWRQR